MKVLTNPHVASGKYTCSFWQTDIMITNTHEIVKAHKNMVTNTQEYGANTKKR